ncbi:hypothetical protein HF526_03705 [Pseudonocardia sp. K10HN5]|uniref:J domain-containing protein n=2 Tax=Pseudonocardia acidicola TaxID=2724939 RepID=A0ABX1S4B1_9PSEU|nr:hypothetical protein [Pseudonocardia acidicola]NMH96429.1 hypothetical protein [Pseudonocardia acidicola]
MTPEERAAYRAFVRDNHPDRGGDPEAFVAGLARFHATRAAARDPEPADRRYDAPIEVVADLPFPVKVAIAAIRTVRRHRRTRVDRPGPPHEPPPQ